MSTSTACGSRLCEIPNTAFFFTSAAGSSLTTRCRISRPRRPRVLPSQNGTFARTLLRLRRGQEPLEGCRCRGVLVQGDRADGIRRRCDPAVRPGLRRDQRLEQRDALGRLDAGQPRDLAAAGVELAVLREHPHALDLAIDDPEQHDHRVGAFELDRRRPAWPGCGRDDIIVPSIDGSRLHMPQQAWPSDARAVDERGAGIEAAHRPVRRPRPARCSRSSRCRPGR